MGLYDYTSITKDPLGLKLFEAGDAEARAEVPHYDTGDWSLYDQYGESDLNYHELLTEFLQHLCERTRKGPPLATPAPAPRPARHRRRPPRPRPRRRPRRRHRRRHRGAQPRRSQHARSRAIRSTARPPQHFNEDLNDAAADRPAQPQTSRGGTRAGRAGLASRRSRPSRSRSARARRSSGATARRVERRRAQAALGDPREPGTYTVTLRPPTSPATSRPPRDDPAQPPLAAAAPGLD